MPTHRAPFRLHDRSEQCLCASAGPIDLQRSGASWSVVLARLTFYLGVAAVIGQVIVHGEFHFQAIHFLVLCTGWPYLGHLFLAGYFRSNLLVSLFLTIATLLAGAIHIYVYKTHVESMAALAGHRGGMNCGPPPQICLPILHGFLIILVGVAMLLIAWACRGKPVSAARVAKAGRNPITPAESFGEPWWRA